MRSFSCVISVRRPFIDAVLVCWRVERSVGLEDSLCAAILHDPKKRGRWSVKG